MKHDKTEDTVLRNHLVNLLKGKGAHIEFDNFVADLPVDLVNKTVDLLPYTIWQVLEHMRIAQWDILEFSRNASHQSPEFPKGYWPAQDRVADQETLQQTINGFRADLKQMESLVAAPATDLFSPIPHGDGQTILREALLVADHNSYHLGALLVMNRILVGASTS